MYTLFADDTTISLQGTQLLGLERGVFEAQLRAEQWFRANKLVLNDGKSQGMVFGFRDLDGGDRRSLQFLGISLDPRLHWDVHVEATAGRLCGVVFLLRGLRGFCCLHTMLCFTL